MLFKPEHVERILSGKMTQIRKLWYKPLFKVGSVQKAKTVLFSNDYFAHVIITGLRKEKLGEITIKDAMKEGYDDLESFKEDWKRTNGLWEPNTIVYVVSFELKEQYDSSASSMPNTSLLSQQALDGEKVGLDFAH